MLVVGRKVHESVIIDGDIRVTVVKVKGQRVLLGIEAPLDLAVDRAEIHALRREFVESDLVLQ